MYDSDVRRHTQCSGRIEFLAKRPDKSLDLWHWNNERGFRHVSDGFVLY
jgi:hypothetical protein